MKSYFFFFEPKTDLEYIVVQHVDQMNNHTANVYRQMTDELIFKSVISTQRYLYF